MALKQGFAAVKEVAERSGSNEAQKGKENIGFIGWGEKSPDNEKIVRFLSEGPFVIPFHGWQKCPDGKNRDFVCAKESPTNPRECPICETQYQDKDGNVRNFYAKEIGVALAVERVAELREVNGRNKKFLKDKLVEVEIDGETVEAVQFGIIKQGIRNYWNHLNGYFVEYGSVMERDFKVLREGQKLDTTYTFISQDPIADLSEVDDVVSHYESKLLDPELSFEKIIEDYVDWMSSEKRYDKFWFGKGSTKDSSETKSSEKSAMFDDDDDTEDNSTSFSSLRSKIQAQLEEDED